MPKMTIKLYCIIDEKLNTAAKQVLLSNRQALELCL